MPSKRCDASEKRSKQTNYFNELLTDEKTPLRLVPSPFTAAIIASEMPAAIRPYSIAVAPVSSDRNRKNKCFNVASVLFVPVTADMPYLYGRRPKVR